MVFDGIGHGLGQAVVQGVVTAHGALQLRELAHHVGHQIGLGQLGGQIGLRHQRGVTQLGGDRLGNRAHAFDALALGAQLVVIDHLAQALDPRGQGLLAVLVEEELGVGQARAHHALVATDHGAGIGRADVADHQELVRQLAGGVQQREVLLVGLHGQDQALLRHIEELLLELADQHIGALDQGRHLIEQGFVFDGAHAVAHTGRGGRQLAHDLGTTLGKARDHGAITAQGVGIGIGMLDRDDRLGGLESVTQGGVARLQAQHLERHHAGAMQGDHAVRRAHEVHAAPAGQLAIGFELVGHDLRDRQLGQRFF